MIITRGVWKASMRRSLFGSLSLVMLGSILLSLLLPIPLEAQDEGDFIQELMDGMSVEEILRINNLTKAQAIYPGQKLLLTPSSPQ